MEYRTIYKCKFCQKVFFEDDEEIETDIEKIAKVVHRFDKPYFLHRCYKDDIRLGLAEVVGFKKIVEERDVSTKIGF